MNRLGLETSPYLLQHAENPVDWYPWGEEAFARARREDRPVLLSIGYSACHWCHVMERESFRDPATAALMNERFVNVKVDREERPDIDSSYMEAVVACSGRGGWPATVFLTPGGKPFYAGTYFPPVARSGLPAFLDVLVSVSDAYRERRPETLREAATLAETVARSGGAAASADRVNDDLLEDARRALSRQFDGFHGGFGGPPKFPFAPALEFLLLVHARTRDAGSLRMATKTLDAMAAGGIYDQLGGGFHRYAADTSWLVPHFEKMLSDNALLARLYLHAWLATGVPRYRRVAQETIDHLLRDMQLPEAAFGSSLDADTIGAEGGYYCWKLSEIRAALPPGDAELAIRRYCVTAHGTFRATNVLHLSPQPPEPDAHLEAIRRRLLDVREERPRPARDDKVIAAWNGLVLRTLAEAGTVLGRTELVSSAERLAEFVLAAMSPDGRLDRVWRHGRVRIPGQLEDYAAVAAGLLALYLATGHRRWLDESEHLARRATELFAAPDGGAFFSTQPEVDTPLGRRKPLIDHPAPSGNSMLADVLLRLARLLDDDDLERAGTGILASSRPAVEVNPLTQGHLLCAVDFHLSPRRELVIAGPAEDPSTVSLRQVAWEQFDPHLIVVLTHGRDDSSTDQVPVLAGKGLVAGRPGAYVCEHFSCRRPVTDPATLRELLASSPEDEIVEPAPHTSTARVGFRS